MAGIFSFLQIFATLGPTKDNTAPVSTNARNWNPSIVSGMNGRGSLDLEAVVCRSGSGLRVDELLPSFPSAYMNSLGKEFLFSHIVNKIKPVYCGSSDGNVPFHHIASIDLVFLGRDGNWMFPVAFSVELLSLLGRYSQLGVSLELVHWIRS